MVKPAITNRLYEIRSESSLLQLLRQLDSPQTMIHIGAGSGQGPLHQWHNWGVPHALLVDADAARLDWADRVAAANPAWRVVVALLAAADDTITFYRASDPAEDGLIQAELLRSLCPDTFAIGQDQRAAKRLDTLLNHHNGPTILHGKTWLLVDCLPALAILQGADGTLRNCSVIGVRALLQLAPELPAGCSFSEINSFLQGNGFKHVGTIEDHQLIFGHFFFAKDWQSELQEKTSQYSKQSQIVIDMQQAVSKSQQAVDDAHALIQKLQANNQETAYRYFIKAEAQIEFIKDILFDESYTSDEFVEPVFEVNEMRTNFASPNSQKDQPIQENQHLNFSHSRKNKQDSAQSLEELRRSQYEVSILLKRIEQLKLQVEENTYHRQLQQQELFKAEAQIELIKDLLL